MTRSERRRAEQRDTGAGPAPTDSVEATLPHLATKADVQAAVNALTWKLIVAGVALSGVIIAAIAAAAAWIKLF